MRYLRQRRLQARLLGCTHTDLYRRGACAFMLFARAICGRVISKHKFVTAQATCNGRSQKRKAGTNAATPTRQRRVQCCAKDQCANERKGKGKLLDQDYPTRCTSCGSVVCGQSCMEAHRPLCAPRVCPFTNIQLRIKILII